jgi:prepilin-type N-terminal cleavage/methylation domain-containing protein
MATQLRQHTQQGIKAGSDTGFTLIEVVLTLVLAGLAIAVLSKALLQSIYLQKVIDGRITAVVLGRSKLSELEAGSERDSSGEFPTPYQQFRWMATTEFKNGNNEIRLTVKWGDSRASFSHQKEFAGWSFSGQ